MPSPTQAGGQFTPRLHNQVYPFIYPSKFKATLDSQVILITGSVGTLGQALAESFAVAGANLWLVYNRTAPPQSLRDRCLGLGASSVTNVQCDVASYAECLTLTKRLLDKEGKVDVLVNNAGANSLGPVCLRGGSLILRLRTAEAYCQANNTGRLTSSIPGILNNLFMSSTSTSTGPSISCDFCCQASERGAVDGY
ncbi:hypothetical protein DL546_000310 [Coniochaeta pulveracea]|uniref:Uncharacterized protein n=1 Tax=Coniochaeta pulveracea TaxID=177199 RepID=A0A420XW24_9PEZI|nr:hypothetical protein DL546_000310 [Coniochaeta pulveracea]